MLKTLRDDQSALSNERRAVCEGSQRRQIKLCDERIGQVRVARILGLRIHDRLDDFERDAGAAQLPALPMRSVRIDQRHGLGPPIQRHMVIDDDRVDAALPERADRVGLVRSAINEDRQFRRGAAELLDERGGHTVSVSEPVRLARAEARPQPMQHFVQDDAGGQPIHIRIAEDGDRLLLCDRAAQPIDRPLHVRQRAGIVEPIERRREKFHRRRVRVHSAIEQQLRCERFDAELGRQRRSARHILGLDAPERGHQSVDAGDMLSS